MPSPVLFHPAAADEAEAAADWYSERSPRAGRAFILELEHAVASLAAEPERWPRGPDDTRRLVLRRFPFVVIYRVSSDALTVVAVAHGRRRPAYWKSRHER